jgi:hypothetical protein
MIVGSRRPRVPDLGTGVTGLAKRALGGQAWLVTPPFLPGLELSKLYYLEVIRPLLDDDFPGLAHCAALIGPGSEVLGLDSARSMDHHWGPRCLIFTADAGPTAEIDAMLTRRLPGTFRGHRTVFPASGAPVDDAGHWVTVAGLGQWLTGVLGFDPRRGVTLLDWLAAPTQQLAEVTAGAVFHDGLRTGQAGGLATARDALAWYPDDIWRYLLACQWQRIGQEEAFPGRCAESGDDLGSVIVAARLARDLIRLVLMMRRRYPPYSKWLGSAFAQVPGVARELRPLLTEAVLASTWPDRERNLCGAYQAVAVMHNELRLTRPVDVAVRPFYDRPYQVMGAERFVHALQESIGSAQIRLLPLTGGVDQFVDNTDATADHALLRAAVSALLKR